MSSKNNSYRLKHHVSYCGVSKERVTGNAEAVLRVVKHKLVLQMPNNWGYKGEEIEMKSKIKDIISSPEFYFTMLIVFFELLFHFVRFGMTLDNVLYKLLFALFYGMVIGALVSLLPRRGAVVAAIAVTAVIALYFIVQIIYSGVFNTYLSVAGSIRMTGQAFDFMDVITKEIAKEWWVIVLMLVPAVLLTVILRKLLCFERHTLSGYAVRLIVSGLLLIVTVAVMQIEKKSAYSAYEVYKTYPSVDMAVEKLGVSESLWLDVKAGIAELLGISVNTVAFVEETHDVTTTENNDEIIGTETEIATNTDSDEEEESVEEAIDTSPNILDVDFDAMIEQETDDNIAALHEYIKSVPPTNKNEYTGMFEGYNLIFVVAEGFSGYSIDPYRTPTLYRMSNEGFCFENYYTPLWYGSTLGGEYADLTGLMPKNGGYLSMAKAGSNSNDMMFTLSSQLKRQGYKTIGFHNNDYTYYDRHISHTNMGYEWIGVGNGYEPERNDYGTSLWPQSDLAMVEATFDSYKNEQPFHTYYLTVSGHVMYNFEGNAMAERHKNIVEKLDYTDTTKAYLACQYELELAMAELNRKLEEAGLADNTLIVLTSDHVPYDNKDVLDELAGYELDNTFEWYENTLIIWSAAMEEPVYIDKYCSSLDILPTVSNLMGLPYDSRMLAGQDILSDSEGLVMFNDRSFITDKCSYDANTGEIKSIDGSPIDEVYVDDKINQIKNKFRMAESICDYDYYRYIDEAVYGLQTDN